MFSKRFKKCQGSFVTWDNVTMAPEFVVASCSSSIIYPCRLYPRNKDGLYFFNPSSITWLCHDCQKQYAATYRVWRIGFDNTKEFPESIYVPPARIPEKLPVPVIPIIDKVPPVVDLKLLFPRAALNFKAKDGADCAMNVLLDNLMVSRNIRNVRNSRKLAEIP